MVAVRSRRWLQSGTMYLIAIPLAAAVFWPVPASFIVPLPKLAVLMVLGVAVLVAQPMPLPRWARTDPATYLLPILAMAVVVILGRVALDPNPMQAFWGSSNRLNGGCLYAMLLIAFWGARSGLAGSDSAQVVTAVAVGGIVTGFYAFLQALGWDAITWDQPGLVSSLGNADHTASFFAMATVAGAALVCDQRQAKPLRVAGAICAAIGTAMVLYWAAHEVVQGLLALLVIGAVLAARQAWVSHRPMPRILTVSAASGLLAFAPTLWLVVQTDRGVQDRLSMMMAALRIGLAHPFVGVGFGGVEVAYNHYRTVADVVEFGIERAVDDVHSVPLQLFAETGVLGGLAYAGFVAVSAWVILTTLRRSDVRSKPTEVGAALVALVWLMQVMYSPDSAPLSLAGVTMLGSLSRGTIARDIGPDTPPSAWWRIWRTGLAFALLVLLGQRLYADVRYIIVDSSNTRANQRTSELGRLAQTDQDFATIVRTLKLYPVDPARYVRVAAALGARGDTVVADQLLDRVEHYYPGHPAVIGMLLRRAQARGRIDEAHAYAAEMVDTYPQSPEAWLRLADAQLVRRRIREANATLDSAFAVSLRVSYTDRTFWQRLRRLRTIRDSLQASPTPTQSYPVKP